MRRGQDFWGVSVQRTVVNIQGETYCAAEADVLVLGSDLGVGEEEGHRDESTDHHSVLSTKDFPIAHVPCEHRSLCMVRGEKDS